MDITSDAKRFTGTVKLPDALTYTQYCAIDDATDLARPLLENKPLLDQDGNPVVDQDGNPRMKPISNRQIANYNAAVLPGVLACVEEWHIDGIPAKPTRDNFPVTPVMGVFSVLTPIVTALLRMMAEADEAPN